MRRPKRCKFCGRTGTVMLYLPRHTFSHPARPDEWACHDRQACKRRTDQLGKWVGTRVLRRRDLDGTEWEIRRWDDLGLRGNAAIRTVPTSGYVLVMRYRAHRLASSHPTVDAAKAHVEDYLASLRARSMQDYARGRG